jgi:hypothetical protein
VDTSSTEQPPTSKPIQASDGFLRSKKVSSKPVNWNVSSWAGQKYSFATTQLGKSLIEDDDYQHDPQVAFALMQQMSLKAALKQWVSDADKAGIKEVKELHWRDTYVPKHYSDLTSDEKSKVLESHMFLLKKRSGDTKLG